MKKGKEIIVGIILCVVMLTSWYVLNKEQYLSVVFLDVGQGSSAYIKTPDGYEILVDSGETNKTLRNLSKMRPVWDRHINMFVLSHPDKDHMAMFPNLLRRFFVDVFVETGKDKDFGLFDAVDRVLDRKNTQRMVFVPSQKMEVSPGVYVTILHPSQNSLNKLSDNDSSLIFILEYAGVTFLFTGDASSFIEKELIRKYGETLNIDVLLVGHHGSKTSTDHEFIQTTSPAYAVISSGKDNRYGHPHKQTLETLHSFGVQVLRTDELGNIQFRVSEDGEFDIMVR